MTRDDDTALLRAWTAERSEPAFRAVVERYAGLVFGVALRRTGDRSLAEEAVQNVFADLARKAPVVIELRRPLAAWLHRSAVYEAATLLRGEIRHRDKMKRFASAPSDDEPVPDPWQEVRPLLDEAIDALSETDRRVLLLHWFERRTFADIAARTGASTAAVQRRGLRALDKLATVLRRRGAAVSTVALAAALSPQLGYAAPAGLAASVSAAVTAGAPAAGGFSLFLQHSLHAMASAKLTTAAVVLISAAIPVSVQFAAAPPGHSLRNTATAASPAGSFSKAASSAAPAQTPLDLTALRRALEQARDSQGRSAAARQLARLMFTLSVDEIPPVAALLRDLARGGNGLDTVVEALYTRWAELDPARAAAEAVTLEPGSCKWPAARAAFETWAAADLPAAWDWLQTAVPGGDWWAPSVSTIRRLAGSDPQKVLALLAKTTAPEIRASLPVFIAEGWGKTDPEAALTWALSLPDEAEKSKLAGVVLEHGGERDPALALSLLPKLDNSSARGEAGWNVLWPWALRAPEEAFAEMTKNGGAWPDRLAYGLGDAMARHDAAKAAEAARSMPPGQRRNEFVEGALLGVAYTDPAAVAGIVELVPAKELASGGSFGSFVEAWSRRDPAAAARWIASLPEDDTFLKSSAASRFQAEAGKSWEEVLQTKGGRP